ncbi:hypothetical protein BCR36DRAFT_334478 [Piromyces finnis]|uniref:Uncharacterized protein n=1 Tax=Piromyces finnis TaxID=1754191 RepID=A0A1Y1V2E7_9FUNG|nr:hypothetical protein BCR36DRAFT_334478 [Piromyces finnis]|eukprot:ORX44483.1 hypothetical protein BCR36DRAFT_334478 [Piromyces finnis]
MRRSKILGLIIVSLIICIPFITILYIVNDNNIYKNKSIVNSLSSVKGSFDNNYCGRWQEQYTLLQREIDNSVNKKYLILDAWKNGWGDRLTQIISGFYVALLSKRSFKIIGIDLEEIFEKPNIDWSISKEELEKLEAKNSVKKLYYTEFDKEQWNEGFLYTNFTSNYEDTEALIYRIQNGKLQRIFENVFHKQQLYEMGLRPDTAFGCAFEFLFKPKPEIINIVQDAYDDMKIKRSYYLGHKSQVLTEKNYLPNDDGLEPIRIGLQIRLGDNTFSDTGSFVCAENVLLFNQVKQFFDCAESLEKEILEKPYEEYSNKISSINHKKKRDVYWLLLTDCKILREKAKEKWPGKVITITDKSINHIEKTNNKEALGLAFAEHWLFGEMDYHIITKSSSYGRTASLRRKIYHHIYDMAINSVRSSDDQCSLLNYNTFEETSKHWVEL